MPRRQSEEEIEAFGCVRKHGYIKLDQAPGTLIPLHDISYYEAWEDLGQGSGTITTPFPGEPNFEIRFRPKRESWVTRFVTRGSISVDDGNGGGRRRIRGPLRVQVESTIQPAEFWVVHRTSSARFLFSKKTVDGQLKGPGSLYHLLESLGHLAPGKRNRVYLNIKSYDEDGSPMNPTCSACKSWLRNHLSSEIIRPNYSDEDVPVPRYTGTLDGDGRPER